jgi:DME family drug/metabolite transporter
MARLHVLLAAICFGTTGTAQALGPDGIDPAGVGSARIAIGAAILAAVALAARRGGPSPRWARRPVLAAAAGVAVYQVAFFAAVDSTGVAVGTIVALGSAPTLTGLFEWLLTGRAPERRWVAATCLACAGVALLALSGGDAAGVSAPGIALAVVAGAAYATYTLAAKRLLGDGHAPERVMAVAFGAGAVALLPVLLLSGPGWLASGDGLAMALFLGVVPTALAYLLFARGLKRLSAAETSTLTLAEPLTAGLLGALVLGERVTGAGALGAMLVLAGLVALAARLPHTGREPAPDAAPA